MKSQAFRDNVDDMFMVTAALAKYSVSWTYEAAPDDHQKTSDGRTDYWLATSALCQKLQFKHLQLNGRRVREADLGDFRLTLLSS